MKAIRGIDETSFTMQRLLQIIWEVDNHPQILSMGIEESGIFFPFWMLIRYTVVLELLAAHNYLCIQKSPVRIKLFEKIDFCVNAFKHRIKNKATDILFISPSNGNIEHEEFSINIFHDDFANEAMFAGKTVTVLEQPNDIWKKFKKRKCATYSYSLNWLILKRKVRELIFIYKKQCDNRQINNFLSIIESILQKYGVEPQPILNSVKLALQNFAKTLKFRISSWQQVVKKLNPKVVFMQDAFCGGAAGIAVAAFKKANILVVEDQHGYVASCGTIWNLGKKLKNNSQFLYFLPHYFLCYGPKWVSHLNMNIKKVVIGNPFHTSNKKNVLNRKPIFDLLIISDTERPRMTSSLSIELLKDGYCALFRPHPREWSDAQKIYVDLMHQQQIVFDYDRNFYNSLAKAKIVIVLIGSFMSTVVVEAASCGKPILCFSSDAQDIPDALTFSSHVKFISDFQTLRNHIKLVVNNPIPLSPLVDFYDDNWQTNFRNFIDQIL